jgi:dTDP-4-amino-4,6-dideoxygalactose transaminase
LKVPFSDLNIRHAKNIEKFQTVFNNSLSTSEFILGKNVKKFELDFSRFVNSDFAIGVANGSDALRIGLTIKDLPRGGEVLVAPNTYFAAASAIIQCGLIPRFFDVESSTRFPSGLAISSSISNNTVAIIRSHLFGEADLASAAGLLEIHDCSQAHGTMTNESHVGKGMLSTFSLYPGKNLGALGDGGVITTDSATEYELILAFRNQGTRTDKYLHEVIGFNSRLDSLQAGMLSIKLQDLAAENHRRQKIADIYRKNLESETDAIRLFSTPHNVASTHHLYQVYLKSNEVSTVQEALQRAGVGTGRHYPIPLHLQPALKFLGYSKGDFPNAEDLANKTLSLPNYPEMTDNQVDYVSEALIEAVTQE